MSGLKDYVLKHDVFDMLTAMETYRTQNFSMYIHAIVESNVLIEETQCMRPDLVSWEECTL